MGIIGKHSKICDAGQLLEDNLTEHILAERKHLGGELKSSTLNLSNHSCSTFKKIHPNLFANITATPIELISYHLMASDITGFTIFIGSTGKLELTIEQTLSPNMAEYCNQKEAHNDLLSIKKYALQVYQRSQRTQEQANAIDLKATEVVDSQIDIDVKLSLNGSLKRSTIQEDKLLLELLVIKIVEMQYSSLTKVTALSIEECPMKTLHENILTEKKIISTGMFQNIDISKEHPALARALTYISDNFQNNITMQDLTNACFISSSHLSSLLKHRFGLSFKKILTHMRIEKAKFILIDMPMRQVTLICNDSGFSDLSHFEKTFKKHVGISPSIYRKNMTKGLQEQGKRKVGNP